MPAAPDGLNYRHALYALDALIIISAAAFSPCWHAAAMNTRWRRRHRNFDDYFYWISQVRGWRLFCPATANTTQTAFHNVALSHLITNIVLDAAGRFIRYFSTRRFIFIFCYEYAYTATIGQVLKKRKIAMIDDYLIVDWERWLLELPLSLEYDKYYT